MHKQGNKKEDLVTTETPDGNSTQVGTLASERGVNWKMNVGPIRGSLTGFLLSSLSHRFSSPSHLSSLHSSLLTLPPQSDSRKHSLFPRG